MSSFGSSLINKSGKKIVPKAAGRRRPGATAIANQDAALPSARSSVESTQTPQPDPIANKTIGYPSSAEGSQPQVAINSTPTDIFVTELSGPARAPVVTAASHVETSQRSLHAADNIPAIIATTEIGPVLSFGNSSLSGNTSSITQQRNYSPLAQVSGPSKRRRIDRASEGSERLTSPVLTSKSLHGLDGDEIPVVQIIKRAPTKQPTTTSINAPTSSAEEHAGGQTDSDGLVLYETPNEADNNRSSGPASTGRSSGSAIAPLLTASIAGPKPRAKGSRRQQWQVTTQADLAPTGSRVDTPATNQTDEAGGAENDPIPVVGPKTRKVRKDKGIKKGRRSDQPTAEDGESASPIANDSRNGQRGSTAEGEAPTARTTRGRPIAPLPTPSATETTDATDVTSLEELDPPAGTSSSRLKNLQKRKAKQSAVKAARSRVSATETAAAIDGAVAQSMGAKDQGSSSHLALSSASPLFRVQAQEALRSRRSSTAASDTTEFTVVTEGGTRIRKRYKRQATPPGNETVFIAEKVTPMISLVGRDTENRVGMRSNTEMRMREFDWKTIRREQRDYMTKTALEKGSRKTNDPNLIFGAQSPAPETVKPMPDHEADGGQAQSSSDEDDLDRLIASRKKKFGPSSGGVQITIVNGEHRIDEIATRRMGDSEDIDDQMDQAEELDEDDLKKKPFNVHTFVKWKRRDPTERIYQSSRWNDEETEKFYDALRCCGVDFGSMAPWFPTRIRRSLKRKFNIEERANPQRIEETLKAHMMVMATGDAGGDDGGSWNMAQFHANNAFQSDELLDPRQVDEDLAQLRAEREKEIAAAKLERSEELRNQKLAGVHNSEDEEDEEGEEGDEEDEEEEDLGDMISIVQKELAAKKRREREANKNGPADEQGDDDENEEDDDDEDDGTAGDEIPEGEEVLETVEDDADDYDDDDVPDWDE